MVFVEILYLTSCISVTNFNFIIITIVTAVNYVTTILLLLLSLLLNHCFFVTVSLYETSYEHTPTNSFPCHIKYQPSYKIYFTGC